MHNENRVFLDVASSNVLGSKDVLDSKYEGLKRLAQSNMNADLMFVSFILLHEGANANGDYFTRDEIERSWVTYVGKPITWEHSQPFIGHITDAFMVKPDGDSEDQRWYIECAGVIWKARYPDKAKIIYEGALDNEVRMSMETFFEDAVYAWGSLDNVYTKEQAPFLAKFKGKKYQGKPVYRVFIGCHGAGVGVVANPADKDAVFLSVAERESLEREGQDVVVDKDNNSAYLLIADVGKYNQKEVLGMANDERILENEIQENASEEQLNIVDKNVDTESKTDDVEQEVVPQVNEEESVDTEEENAEEQKDVEVEEDTAEELEEVVTEDVESEDVVKETKEEELESVGDDLITTTEEDPSNEADASLVDKFLGQRMREEAFYQIFDSLRSAILDHVYNFANKEITKDGFRDALNEEINVFIELLGGILSGMLEDWGIIAEANASKDLQEQLAEATQELVKTKSELYDVKKEYAEFKEQIQNEKAEAQKDALAKQRLAQLVEAGVKVSESSKNRWFVRIREMDESTFDDFKDILIESASSTKDVSEEDVAMASKGSGVVVPNLEQINSASSSRVNMFQKFWEQGLKK